MTSKVLLAAVTLFVFVGTASAQTIGVELFGAWTDPIANGNIRRLDATLKFSPRLRGGAGLTLFLGRGLALSVTDSRGTIPVTLEANGGAPGRSQLSVEYRDAVLKQLYGQSDLKGYAGLGLALPALKELREVSSGNLTLFRAFTPDHAALIVNAGTEYRILQHLHAFADLKYEPFASTAEVRRTDYPLDDLEANVHFFVFASGLSIRF